MNLFNRYNLDGVIGIQTALTPDMATSIDLWNDILQGKAPWVKSAEPCGIVGCTIGELANPIGEEIETNSQNERLAECMNKLNEQTHELVQNLVAIGGSVVRPIYTNGKMQFEIIKLGNYIPVSYDLDGTLTACIITKEITENNKKFILLERHNYANKNHSINLELYQTQGEALKKIPLSACEKTKDLTESQIWTNVEYPFIVEVKNRMPNKIDGSSVPCALWQGSENLLRDADYIYNALNWEIEGGKMRVFADEDLFKKVGKDKKQISLYPELNKLFVKLNGNGIDAERITEHAPALRTAQLIEAFNQILRRCELAWNIGKGTLSDMETALQTATQYTGGKKALYSMIDSIESELEEKYRHIAYIFAYMLTVYENVKMDAEIEIKYNDANRKDPSSMKQIALQELAEGIISPAEYRTMFFGEDKETAERNVPEKVVSNNFGGFTIE